MKWLLLEKCTAHDGTWFIRERVYTNHNELANYLNTELPMYSVFAILMTTADIWDRASVAKMKAAML